MLARVACETLITKGLVVVAGEIASYCHPSIPDIVRWTIKNIGYTDPAYGFDYQTCGIITPIGKQSPEISKAIKPEDGEIRAGDQVTVFGYATNETPELMPLGIMLAHGLVRKQAQLRKSGRLDWLRPDAKSQVTVRYVGTQPVSVEKVVFSTQHSPDVSHEELKEAVISEIIKEVIPKELRAAHIRYLVNPGGSFTIGGPAADTGLTGRKIMADAYGPGYPHGGGVFSGKDPTKLDRSAAYMARYIAKNIVAAGLAERCTVELSYAMGKVDPVSFTLDLHSTGKVDEQKLMEAVRQIFKLTPGGIISMLDLRYPIYRKTAAYGHFGRELPEFIWEKRDKVVALKDHFGTLHNRAGKDGHASTAFGTRLGNSLRPCPPYPILPTNDATYARIPVVSVPNDRIKPKENELTIVMEGPYRDTKLTGSARKAVIDIVSWLAGEKGLRTLCCVWREGSRVLCT
jgi:S-adenosylmethionine synthetase